MDGSHTSGPWQCYADLPSTEPNWHIVTNASRMRVIANVHIEPGNTVDEANARLITAAPELLKSLKGLLSICQAVRYTSGLQGNQLERMERAAAIISQVGGRTGAAGLGSRCTDAPLSRPPMRGTPTSRSASNLADAGVEVEEQGFCGNPQKEHPTPGGRDNE